jgi:hypothetical protein
MFRRGGAGRKRDAIEPEVIKALRSVGAEVYQINGRALPDLVVRFRGTWTPLGVKSGEKSRLTRSEREQPPSWAIIRSVDEALREIGAV